MGGVKVHWWDWNPASSGSGPVRGWGHGGPSGGAGACAGGWSRVRLRAGVGGMRRKTKDRRGADRGGRGAGDPVCRQGE